jgi:nucleoside-diphosphate-sugar epimerase
VNGLIVGCGYLGQHVASLWNQQGIRVFALTRSQASAEVLAKQSIQPIVIDWYQRDNWPLLPEIDRMLISVSHAPVKELPASQTHVIGLQNLFEQLSSRPRRIAYLSTTGVYENCDDGRWVDERSPVNASRPGSIAAVFAERWISEHLPAAGVSILRAAGIYGPGRIPRLDKLRVGEPLEVDPDSYLNLIHVEDLARIAAALMDDSKAMGVFNVSDGCPPLRRDYYGFIAKVIGAAEPTFREPDSGMHQSGMASQRRRGEGNKRIDNRHLVETLEYQFRFPNYIAGLSPLL